MNKSSKSTLFRIENVNVVWANLRKPDEFRGSKKHDISVVITPEQQAEMLKLTNGGDIAGIRTGDQGDIILKAKTTVFTKQGLESFDKIFDCEPKQIDSIIGRGDRVNLNVSIYNFDANRYTVLLNGVQLIEKNPEFASAGSGNGTGFGAVDGGFTGTAAPAADEASAPAEGTSPAEAGGATEELPF